MGHEAVPPVMLLRGGGETQGAMGSPDSFSEN